MLVVELVFLFLVFCATIALVQATRKVPVQYAKRIVGNKQYGGVRQYIPPAYLCEQHFVCSRFRNACTTNCNGAYTPRTIVAMHAVSYDFL